LRYAKGKVGFKKAPGISIRSMLGENFNLLQAELFNIPVFEMPLKGVVSENGK